MLFPVLQAIARAATRTTTKRTFIMPAYNLAKSIMPKISPTEEAALNSGTICFDRDLFSGDPTTKSLLARYRVGLSPEEQSFIDNETDVLCEMLDNNQIDEDQNLPPEVWKFIREKKFMGLVIPKAYGGMGFSAHAHSVIVEKVAGRNTCAVNPLIPSP